MRNGQQKRMRGRNNRRSSNPLTRVYESNGPDVKVRGTAHHIAEKYQQLARDAQSSGDPVAAENYFQHAEHYQRLIASLQGQFAPPPGFGRDDELDDDELDDISALDAPQPYARQEIQVQPREVREVREPREPREPRESREPRAEGRSGREGRASGYRRNNNRDEEGAEPREYRSSRAPREIAGDEVPVPRAPRISRVIEEIEPVRPVRTVEEQEDIGLPAFITGAAGAAKERIEPKVEPEVTDAAPSEDTGEGRVIRRRRRFRTRAERAEEATGGTVEAAPEPQPLVGE